MRCIFTVREQSNPTPGDLYLDVRPGHRKLRRNMGSYTKVIQLPLRQFKFMQALMANHPKPMTHWELFYRVWGEGSQDRMQFTDEDGGPLTPSSCIEQYATKLRAKLAPMGLAITSPRKGYGYEINEKEAPADTSSQAAPKEVRPEAADHRKVGDRAPRDPRGSKASKEEPVSRAPRGNCRLW